MSNNFSITVLNNQSGTLAFDMRVGEQPEIVPVFLHRLGAADFPDQPWIILVCGYSDTPTNMYPVLRKEFMKKRQVTVQLTTRTGAVATIYGVWYGSLTDDGGAVQWDGVMLPDCPIPECLLDAQVPFMANGSAISGLWNITSKIDWQK